MENFTFYLNNIDETRFSTQKIKYNKPTFLEEWKAAWHAYHAHIDNASGWASEDARTFARNEWRQNSNDPNCIRYKELKSVEFDFQKSLVVLSIFNCRTNKTLTFRYEKIQSFVSNEEFSGMYEGADLPSLFLEELRFDSDKTYEHEMIFFNWISFIIRAKEMTINISSYLSE